MTRIAGGCWRPTTAGTPFFRIPAFSAAISGNVAAEAVAMIQPDRRDHRERGPLHHVGGVEASPEPGLQKRHRRRARAKCQKRRRGRDLEERDRGAGIGFLGRVECGHEGAVIDRLPGDQNPFVESQQVRGNVGIDRAPGCPLHGAQHGDDGTLPVGAGHMDHMTQIALGIAQLPKQALDSLQRKVDGSRMKLGEAGQPRVKR